MNEEFGRILRHHREKAEKSMGELARHLGVSVPYLSDVERGNRLPLTKERIYKTAELLDLNPEILLTVAAQSRGAFELDATEVSQKAREVGAALMRGWSDLSEEDLEKIHQIVGSGESTE